ncbi:DUF2939 domain-containing protein [Acinetobacter sp. ANC 3813]|uniref:DUF2939 domain-containing protein n=1 Tax=Acinetobacter sp. ANC 3813 TaxID=1977873 RepID=UPI001D16FCBD|nr:DUF2939 domain-containing protein [Acinetobacter sp. ANC 3813]
MAKMKKLKILITASIVLFLVLFFASPYWVLHQINLAYLRNDAAALAQYIDFEKVRSSLKPQIQDRINRATHLEHLPAIMQQWGGQLSHALSEQAVSAAVNEQSIFLLLQGKDLKTALERSAAAQSIRPFVSGAQAGTASAAGLTENEIQPKEVIKVKTQAHYIGWNRFEVAVPNDAGLITRFEMRREQFSWRIVLIKLPN